MKSSATQLLYELKCHIDNLLEYGPVAAAQDAGLPRAPWFMPMSEGVPFGDDKKGFAITDPPIFIDVRIEKVKCANLRIPEIIDELRLAPHELAYHLSCEHFTELQLRSLLVDE